MSEKNARTIPAEESDEGARACPTCEGSGWVRDSEDDSEEEGTAKAAAFHGPVHAKLAALHVDADLEKIADRCPPFLLAEGRKLLLAARAEGRTADYAAAFGLLATADASALLDQLPIAGEDHTAASRTGLGGMSGADLAWLEREHGITAERVGQLVRKYGITKLSRVTGAPQ